MSPEKSKELADKHFLLKDIPWGICVGDGWYDILDELFEKIESIETVWEGKLEVVQIKEKFGTLRVYLKGGTREIYQMIDEADKKSSVTCEECGQPGTRVVVNHWIKTLCPKCQEAS